MCQAADCITAVVQRCCVARATSWLCTGSGTVAASPRAAGLPAGWLPPPCSCPLKAPAVAPLAVGVLLPRARYCTVMHTSIQNSRFPQVVQGHIALLCSAQSFALPKKCNRALRYGFLSNWPYMVQRQRFHSCQLAMAILESFGQTSTEAGHLIILLARFKRVNERKKTITQCPQHWTPAEGKPDLCREAPSCTAAECTMKSGVHAPCSVHALRKQAHVVVYRRLLTICVPLTQGANDLAGRNQPRLYTRCLTINARRMAHIYLGCIASKHMPVQSFTRLKATKCGRHALPLKRH